MLHIIVINRWKVHVNKPPRRRNPGNSTGKYSSISTEVLYHLKPWTQYALYIETYTVSTTDHGAISPIVYFTTSEKRK